MSCSKYTLTNNGSSLAKFSFRRCSDNMDFFNIGIDQGSFKNIWFVDGTFSKDGDIEIVNSISPFPSPTACQRIPEILIQFSSDTLNNFYKSGNAGNDMDFDIYLNNSTACTVDWGDGNTNTYTGTYINPTHTYLSNGIFIIKVTFDDFNEVDELNIFEMPVLQVNGCEFLTSLQYLYIEDCILTSFDTLSAPLSPILEELYLDDNWLTSFTPSYLLPDSLIDFDISNNYYLKTLTLLEPLPSNLNYFDISDCGGNYPSSYYGYGVPGENGGITSPFNYAIPNSLNNLYLDGNKISEFNPTFDIINSQLTNLNIHDNSLTSFDVNLPDSLTDLYVYTNPLTSFNPVFTSASTIDSIECYDTTLTTFDSSVALPSSLRYLDFSDNKPYGGVGSYQGTFGQSGLTTFDPTIALPNGLLGLYLNNNSLTIFNPTPNIPTTIDNLYLQNNLFTTLGTNTTLFYLSNILTGPSGTIEVNGTGNAAPTVGPPDGTTAVSTLNGNGYTVNTN
jgi:Leucine-rich repeat (LRR) protein